MPLQGPGRAGVEPGPAQDDDPLRGLGAFGGWRKQRCIAPGD